MTLPPIFVVAMIWSRDTHGRSIARVARGWWCWFLDELPSWSQHDMTDTCESDQHRCEARVESIFQGQHTLNTHPAPRVTYRHLLSTSFETTYVVFQLRQESITSYCAL